jgi:hypothetical protein
MGRVVQPATVYLLCATLVLTQSASAFLSTSSAPVKVAFVGVAFEDVNADLRKKIVDDLLSLMREETTLQVLSPEEVVERIGEERQMKLLSQMQKNDLLDLAAQLEVDYVFAGTLSNQSRDPNRTLLIGSFQRFDRLTRNVFSLDILRYAQDLGEEYKKIKQEFILTILPPPSRGLLAQWPVLLIGGIALVGVIALLLSSGKTSGEERVPSEPITN